MSAKSHIKVIDFREPEEGEKHLNHLYAEGYRVVSQSSVLVGIHHVVTVILERDAKSYASPDDLNKALGLSHS
jgi:hypothetical protein